MKCESLILMFFYMTTVIKFDISKCYKYVVPVIV